MEYYRIYELIITEKDTFLNVNNLESFLISILFDHPEFY